MENKKSISNRRKLLSNPNEKLKDFDAARKFEEETKADIKKSIEVDSIIDKEKPEVIPLSISEELEKILKNKSNRVQRSIRLDFKTIEKLNKLQSKFFKKNKGANISIADLVILAVLKLDDSDIDC